MNWLQKIASVSFWLEGSKKISQPKSITNLSYMLQTFAEEKLGYEIGIHSISPDGDTDSQFTGTINWYITNEVPEDQQRQIMQAWVREMQIMDYRISVAGPQISGMNRWKNKGSGSGGKPLMVYRIKVLKNGSEDFMQIPKMNASNDNARDLMTALGVPFDWSGSISLAELQTKLEMFTPYHQQELVRPREEGNEQKVQWTDMGRSEDQVQWYVDQMRNIVNFGLQNGFDTLAWG